MYMFTFGIMFGIYFFGVNFGISFYREHTLCTRTLSHLNRRLLPSRQSDMEDRGIKGFLQKQTDPSKSTWRTWLTNNVSESVYDMPPKRCFELPFFDLAVVLTQHIHVLE